MQYFVYILECSDKSLYVGCTNNLEKRIEQHNDSKWGAHYTKIRRPVVLKYQEIFSTLKEAGHRETEIKGWRREKKFNLINNMLEDKDPEEIIEITEIAQNNGLDMEEAEHVKEIMDSEGLDEEEAVELKDDL